MPEFAQYEPMTLGTLRDFLERFGFAIILYRLHFNDHIETIPHTKISDDSKLGLPVKTWMLEKFTDSDRIIHLNVFIKEDG
jgi:hypothetical protein